MHFLRTKPAQVPKGSAEMVAAVVRTILAQPDAELVHEQLDTISHMRERPKVETMLHGAADDIASPRPSRPVASCL